MRGLAKRLVGSTDLLGRVFRWGGEDYLVNDIHQDRHRREGGQAMMAYTRLLCEEASGVGGPTPFAATHKIVGSLQFTKSPRGPTLRFYEKRTKGVRRARCPNNNSAFDIRAVRERIEGDAETRRMRKRRDSCTAYDRAWREGEERRGQRRVRVLPPSLLVGKQGLGLPPASKGLPGSGLCVRRFFHEALNRSTLLSPRRERT